MLCCPARRPTDRCGHRRRPDGVERDGLVIGFRIQRSQAGALNTSPLSTIRSRLIRWRLLGLIVLLAAYVIQALAASPYHAVTFDEQYHITPGYVYLKTGDLRFHHDQNPPLFEAILSLPLLFRSDINLPTDHPAYAVWGDVYLFSDVFLWHANSDAQGIVQSGRIVAAIVGALLGLLLFVWGKQLFGEVAGWMAILLFAFDPNFIANAIPTLDLGLAFTCTLAGWRLWHYVRRPTKFNLLLTGLALGFALGTKFLSVMLLPTFALVLLVYSRPSRLTHYLLLIIRFLSMLLVAWLVLWFTYRFQFGPVDGAGLPVPAPQYFESFIGMFLKSSEGRANYLMGQVSTTGWWYYFIAALVIKTPLPTLLLILVGFLRWPWKREWRESIVLVAPALLFFIGASISKLQLGYRYLLPALPFLFLIASRVILSDAWRATDAPVEHRAGPAKNLNAPRKRFLAALGMTLLAAWLIIGTLSIFPHHLAYFNELIGGPANGYNYLVDSNVDWGQDLPALKAWIDRNQPDNLHLGFFGSAYPDRYGVQAKGVPGYPLNAYGREVDGFTAYSLEPGQYALSATLLRVGLVAKQFNVYAAFQKMTPIARAAYSILIYDVQYPIDADVDRAVIVGPLAADVPPDALGYRAGHPLRAKWCEPAQCFIYTPHPARYVVQGLIPLAPNRAQVAELAPGSNVFELDATTIIGDKLIQLQSLPVAAPDGITATYPITFDNGLSLVGYEAQGSMVHTYWRVTDHVQPPVTVFVHVLDAQGNIVGQDDSFGAATRMLEPGDVIVQRHPLSIKPDTAAGTYRLEVGLYNPGTMHRFTAHPSNAPPTDRLLLSAIEIRP